MVRKYTEIPYIDSCPVPACHSPVLWYWPAWSSQRSAPEKRAGQPALVTNSAVLPPKKQLKSSKWSSHPPLAHPMASDLVPEAEVCFLRGWPPGVLVPGGGVHTPGGREGGSAQLGWKGGKGYPLILPVICFLEEVKRFR